MIKKKKESIDIENLNNVILLGKKILKVLYIAIILGIVLLAIIVLGRLKIGKFILSILSVLSPLFIGLLIAWLLDPLVTYFTKKNVKRGLASVFVFAIFIVLIFLIFRFMVPMLYKQINDFLDTLPALMTSVTSFANTIFDKLGATGFDFSSAKEKVYEVLSETTQSLTNSMPSKIIGGVSSTVSRIGSIAMGLIIGFYLLIDFDRMKKIFDIIPKSHRKSVLKLAGDLDQTGKDFVQGTLLISLIMAIVSTILFAIIGLPSPLLFGIIIGLTNIIPYIGPWIGGALAAIVGFTVSVWVGLLAIGVAIVTQQIDGLVLKPLIMSRAMKLHPVTIVVSLLVFGYYWSIIGMIVATPVVACIKVIIIYLNNKYHLADRIFKPEEIV